MDETKKKFRPLVLMIIDGWGLSAAWGGNAIAINSPTFINAIWRQYPHEILQISKPNNQGEMRMGNSEVGHVSIGAGRIMRDDYSDITDLIENGQFYQNSQMKKACALANAKKSNLHIIGLLSQGAIQGHFNHLVACLEMAKREGIKRVALHLISDGVDDSTNAATEHVIRLQVAIKQIGLGKIVSLMGRHYAMDNRENWDRTITAYRAQALGEAYTSDTPLRALAVSYDKGYGDDSIPPVVMQGVTDNTEGKPYLPMTGDDVVIFANFRSSGIRQLARVYSDYSMFDKMHWNKTPFVGAKVFTLTDYKIGSMVNIIFPSIVVNNTLGDVVAKNGLKQLRASETEKAENVTFFFNGLKEGKLPGEDDLIVQSPKPEEYENTPELSIEELSKRVSGEIKSGKYDFVLLNFANMDVLAHTGNFIATNKAVMKVDEAVKMVVETTLKTDGAVIITSDHGNAEQMIHRETAPNKMRHTNNPVPFILVTPYNHRDLLHSAIETPSSVLSNMMKSQLTIADIAPTTLELMGLEIPAEMAGKSLLNIIK